MDFLHRLFRILVVIICASWCPAVVAHHFTGTLDAHSWPVSPILLAEMVS